MSLHFFNILICIYSYMSCIALYLLCEYNFVCGSLSDIVSYLQWLGGSEFSGGMTTSDSYGGEGSPPQNPVVSVPEALWGRQGHCKVLFIDLCALFIVL